MKRWILVLPGLMLLGAAASNWGMKFNTGFETPNYQAGMPLNGQDDWQGLVPGAVDAAMLVADPKLAGSGRRAIVCLSSDLRVPPWTKDFWNGAWRRPVELDAVTIPAEVRVEADMRLDGPITGIGPEADLVSINFYAINGTRRSPLFYLSGNGNAYANAWTTEYVGGDPAKLNQNYEEHKFETPIKIGAYNKLAITLNYITQLATFEVNNKTIGQLPFGGPGQQFTHVLFEFAALTTEYVETLYPGQYPSYDPMAYTAYWDNVSVRANPAH